MKKVIVAADNQINWTPELEQLLIEQITNIMYDAGYDVTTEGTGKDLKFHTKHQKYPDKMPKISLSLDLEDNKYIYCTAKLTFPVLTINEGDFVDTIEHWLHRWSDIGNEMTQLSRFEFDIEAWTESLEDEKED